MVIYLAKRLLSLIPVLFTVSIAIFLIIHITPGDPATVILGDEASPEELKELRTELGLDQPILQQYLSWLTSVISGDFGDSYFMHQPVITAIIEHLGPTLSLALIAQFLSLVIAIPLGIIAAKKRGTMIDQGVMTVSLFGMSLPSFLLGLLLILIIGVSLRWLPVAGYAPLSEGFWEHYKYLLMPSIALGAIQSALIARMTRSSMLDVLNMDFIKTAKAKGIHENKIIFIHAFRNAFLPILTVIGQTFGTLIAGAVVTETIFNIPGLGQLVINSVERRDYPMIQGVVLFVTLSYVFINLVIDILYGFIDPRVRVEK
ncbi:ABC transporter permease [Neobacillus niacini]|uniref:ABC transporter permease n=1 Tax=Neobacillus niacini TaxID=86668 RepID=UPI0030029C21